MLSFMETKPTLDTKQLFKILATQRPAGSESENQFVTDTLLSVPGAHQDEFGNVLIPVNCTKTRTMFSCHTDTVHPKPHADFINRLQYDGVKEHLFTDGKSQLGADDGTGIWFMLNMIEAEVPGLYVFHREEEIGGTGSDASAELNKNYIESLGIERCIAFDRHYYSDVITHQGGRCASDEFAKALAAELNQTPGFDYKPDDSGVFTDSANYTHMIQECTNISVGYWAQHTVKETQDIGFAVKLLDRLIKVNWEALPTVRDVNDNEPAFDMYDLGYKGNYANDPYNDPYNELMFISTMKIDEMVEVFPEAVGNVLTDLGFTDHELRTMIEDEMLGSRYADTPTDIAI